MTRRSVPTRSLPDRPHLDQLRRQAKDLLEAFRRGSDAATREVRAHVRGADPADFALHDAQLVLARAYGFDSWPKLRALVDGATVRRLVEAVQAGDLATVRSMVDARPELVHLDLAESDESQALHHAVLHRRPEIVRFLMQHDADARKGIWPHRSATTALTLAAERGDDDIVGIIHEEEGRRAAPAAAKTVPAPARHDPVQAAHTAIAAGDVDWLEARFQEGLLANGVGLLSHAVSLRQAGVLERLLQLGLDPDESDRVQGVEEVVPTWGAPLRACARAGEVAMAGTLLAHGANANTNVYAASSALHEAYQRGDDRMIALLEAHGGRLTPVAIAELGLVEQAAKLLAGDQPPVPGAGPDVAWDLLWGAIESPSPEIVALALQAVDRPPDDPRWHGILENGLYLRPDSDRPRHLEAFRRVLDRTDATIRSRRGTTLLHEVAASRGGLTAEDRRAYTTLLLDRGARLDVRDHLLESTPLGWACRWERLEMVDMLLARGADPVEADGPPWASPAARAAKIGRLDILARLEAAGRAGGR